MQNVSFVYLTHVTHLARFKCEKYIILLHS
jgi:hypothetical protein